MNIIYLKTSNFRNIISFEETFSKRVNVFFGDNAQGKTNLIEAIYVIGTTKSFRRVEDSKLINFNSNCAKIESIIVKNDIEKEVSFVYDKLLGKKRIFLNNKSINKYSEYIGNVNVTLFCPEDLMIINGDASFRRSFLDTILCQTDRVYLYDLLDFQRVLKHRNNILKEIKEGKSKSLLEPWDDQFIKYSSKIVNKRLKNISIIEEKANICHKKLKYDELLSIKYTNTISCGAGENSTEYEIALKTNQKRVLGEEIKRGFTLLGPHRDDIEIRINGINTRTFGSQGQKRSAAISIRLAEAEFIHSETKEYPVLLLDDIFSELDEQRKIELMEFLIGNHQTFITGTDLEEFKPLLADAKQFHIKDGKVLNL